MPARVMDAISLPASLDSLEQVASYVRALAGQGHLPAEAEYRLRLAAEEIVTNLVMHGYGERPGEIQLSGDVDEGRVWLRVVDDAPRFDPRTVHLGPQGGVPVQQMRLGGLGLYLTREAVDGFSYEFAGGRNVNTLTISCAGYGGCG
jgi:serine/threonine-protein kinase RsbW